MDNRRNQRWRSPNTMSGSAAIVQSYVSTSEIQAVLSGVRQQIDYHSRHIRRLRRIARALQSAEVVVDMPRPPSVCSPVMISQRRPSALQVVSESVRTFGPDQFTLEQLCSRVAAIFPDVELDREVISRRLYDLRCGAKPSVVVVDLASSSPSKMKHYRYRPP